MYDCIQLRKFMLPNSSRYEDLSSKLVELFPQLETAGSFTVTWINKDGDEVRVNLFCLVFSP